MRLRQADQRVMSRLLESAERSVKMLSDLLEREPARLLQTRLNLLAARLTEKALVLYVLGESIDEVIRALHQSVDARMAVLRARRPADGFEVLEVKMLEGRAARGPSAIVMSAPPDWSVGNAGFAYQTTTMAITLGRTTDAREAARLAWDPPNAPYVGRGKFALYCRGRQRLAYAVRRLLAGETNLAAHEAMAARDEADTKQVSSEAGAVLALARSDRDGLVAAIRGILSVHVELANSADDVDAPDYALSFPALAWSRWSIMSGLAGVQDIPWSEVYAPREFVGTGAAD